MPDILLMADSACDIDRDFAKKTGMRIVPCHVETAFGSYLDGVDFTAQDVFDYVEQHGGLPATSQVTAIEWMEAYRAAAAEGRRDILVVTMNAAGSGTYAAAVQGAALLAEEEPELAKSVTVRVVDSTGYSVPVGLAIRRVQKLIDRGASAREAEAYLNEWYGKQEILLGLGSLTYAKKSGRLNTVAAFVGEVLGLKPIMLLHTANSVVAKARGERAMIDRIADLYIERAEDPKGDYALAYGRDDRLAKLLTAAIKKRGGGSPTLSAPMGTCIAINTGPDMIGIGFRGKGEAKPK